MAHKVIAKIPTLKAASPQRMKCPLIFRSVMESAAFKEARSSIHDQLLPQEMAIGLREVQLVLYLRQRA